MLMFTDLPVACCHGAAELHDTMPDQQLTQEQQSTVEDCNEGIDECNSLLPCLYVHTYHWK